MARGDLSKSPGKGKKIDTLSYEVVEVDGFESVRLSIDVFMSKDFGHSDSAPKPVTGASFSLLCKGERVEGTDINACITAMRSKLDRRFAIKWTRWLKVSIEKSRLYDVSGGTGIELQWKEVERGKAFDGSDLMRCINLHGNKTWRIEPWPEYFKNRSGKTLACIESTEENIAALVEFKAKIDQMRAVLADFVSPENIDDTLRLISNGGMNLIPNSKHV
ncbi:MAG: hypothetical protein ABJL67_09645 [Sulfitobacter sp.]